MSGTNRTTIRERAEDLAAKHNHQKVDIWHLMALVAEKPHGMGSCVLRTMGVNLRYLFSSVQQGLMHADPKDEETPLTWTERASGVLESIERHFPSRQADFAAGTEFVLFGFLDWRNNVLTQDIGRYQAALTLDGKKREGELSEQAKRIWRAICEAC